MGQTSTMKPLNRWIPLIGFILLVIAVIGLLISTSMTAWAFTQTSGIITLIISFGAVFAIIYEGQNILNDIKANDQTQPSRNFPNFLAVLIGGIITFFLSEDIGLGPVIATSLAAILAQMIVPAYGVPFYCGTFVGMTSDTLLFNHYEVVLASVIAGVAYILTSRVFNGFGGKLGTIALIGTAATGIGLGRQFHTAPISNWQTNGLIILIAMVATPLTFYLNYNRKNGSVMASAVVGLIGGLILPVVFPQYGNNLAVVAICASFAGMTSAKRCKTFWHTIIAGLFTGIVFMFSAPLLGGAGGKLGTIAFGAILSTYGYVHFFQRLSGTNSQEHSNRLA